MISQSAASPRQPRGKKESPGERAVRGNISPTSTAAWVRPSEPRPRRGLAGATPAGDGRWERRGLRCPALRATGTERNASSLRERARRAPRRRGRLSVGPPHATLGGGVLGGEGSGAAQTPDQRAAPCQRMRRGGGGGRQPASLCPGKGAAPEAEPRAGARRPPRQPHRGGRGDRDRAGRQGSGAQRPDHPAPPADGEPPGAEPWPRRRGGGGREGKGSGGSRRAALTVDVLPVADVLQVAARVLPAQLGLGAVGLQPGVGIPAQLGAGGDAAGGGVPHLLGPAPAPAPAREEARGGRSAGAAGSHGQQQRRRRGGEEAAAAAPCGCTRRRVPPAAHPRRQPRSAARRRGLRQLSPPPRAGSAGPAEAQPHRRRRGRRAPPPPPRSRRARSTHAPTRQRRSLHGSRSGSSSGGGSSSRPGRPPLTGSGSSGR